MRNRAKSVGKRLLVPPETMEFVYMSVTGVVPSFNGREMAHFTRSKRIAYIYLLRRSCGLNADDISLHLGVSSRWVLEILRDCRVKLFPSYTAYYDAEFASIYHAVREGCRAYAGYKPSTIKKYAQIERRKNRLAQEARLRGEGENGKIAPE